MQFYAMKRKLTTTSILLVLCAVSACGGGGSSSTPAIAPPIATALPPPPPPPPGQSTVIIPTSFSEESVLRGLSFDFGFATNMDSMVRQFAGGGASGDIDLDGDFDLIITRGNLAANLVYLNEGSQYREDADGAGIAYTLSATENGRHSAPTLADIDQDGDLDLFLGGLEGDPNKLFLNDGTGIFSDVTAGSGLDLATSTHTISAAFGDYDRDGDLDLSLAHWGTPRDASNPGETETLWRNDSTDGQVKFTPVSQSAGLSNELALSSEAGVYGPNYDYTFAPSFTDINQDGWPDLLMVADFGGSRVFRNNQDGTFSNITDTTEITDENGMGSAVGDFDNDGDMDWFVSSINGNRLYENTGQNLKQAASTLDVLAGGWGWGSCFADFNSDGWLDIYQTNGWFPDEPPGSSDYTEDTSRLWMNDGAGGFEDRASDFDMLDTEQGRGIICDDFDQDGDVDVLLFTTATNQAARLWTNQLANPQYLAITLTGTSQNPYGIGARIEIEASGLVQTREVTINSNFTSHNSTQQVFGLDRATRVTRISVTWPDGATSQFSDLNPNQNLTITHPSNGN